ncbi:hypothetical protein B0T17DRAFT_534656 [Bombardia bombarda]|uniref:Uncharacterized protein n=1 Tax=Bombardia bombarda TaxID=252184 RepID=A0AA39WU60_9PEZI|nr:hypothetical protein B0T17DRAFT_534656 [Bombardia bombarda]
MPTTRPIRSVSSARVLNSANGQRSWKLRKKHPTEKHPTEKHSREKQTNGKSNGKNTRTSPATPRPTISAALNNQKLPWPSSPTRSGKDARGSRRPGGDLYLSIRDQCEYHLILGPLGESGRRRLSDQEMLRAASQHI